MIVWIGFFSLQNNPIIEPEGGSRTSYYLTNGDIVNSVENMEWYRGLMADISFWLNLVDSLPDFINNIV